MNARMSFHRCAATFFAAAVLCASAVHAQKVGSADIGGVVNGPRGPEAGVWVIAETTGLPTKFAKVVVTDSKGRFLIPELPKANYSVWVRGYGLVDSSKVSSARGKTLKLRALAAPSEKDAAEYYPGMYWYSLLAIPEKSEFPGTGEKGNGISENMKQQHYWIDTVKHSCQSCHALGSKGMRTVPEQFAKSGSSLQVWARRTQSGQAMTNMALSLGNIGAERALKQFADWTDRIASGELPFAKPERPKGIERNLVVTMWDFSEPKYYLHDGISSYQHNPGVNANGPIYGSPEESTDLVPALDPVKHRAYQIKHPVLNPNTPSSLTLPMQPSAYWGDKPIWDGHSSIHNNMMDAQGRVWFSARIRPAANPDFCKQGSDHPSAKVVPLNESARQVSVYDPKTGQWRHVDTCFSTHHLYFAKDANNTLWLSQGGPQSGVVGWVNTKLFLETGDSAKAQGWTPIIVDANGNGKRDEWVGPKDPLDPAKDKRIMAAFYGIMPCTVDDSVWGQAMDVGFSRVDQPGYIVRLVPGPDPSNTSLAEIYLPPEGTFGSRGLDMDLNGLVWTTLSSGHMASFDRKKCQSPLNGPSAVTGKHCPEGWTLYQMPGPQFKGLSDPGSANQAYYVWVDRYNTLGLGVNVPIASTNGGESLLAVVDSKLVELRVPYPLCFFSKLVDGRIDNPDAGWKGRGLWTMSGRERCSTTRAVPRTTRRYTSCRCAQIRWRTELGAAGRRRTRRSTRRSCRDEGAEMKPSLHVANAMVAALLGAIGAMNATAADLSVDQVSAMLKNASPSAPADFGGKDLSDLDLSGLDFRNANLRGVSFFASKLVRSDFRGATLEGANLNGAWLMGTDFTGANLTRASLLSVVILGGAVKKMPVFKGANLTGVKMIADLPGADLSGANLSHSMVGVNIKNQGMGQMRTDLSNANLAGATLAGADFNRSLMTFSNLKGSDLRGANFFRVKLGGADLTGADVTGADFTEADLDGTIFRGVKGFAEAKGFNRAENFDKIVR